MTCEPKMSLIVAMAENGVIGRDGDLPWRLSSDLKHFKKVTMGKPVLMGRVTWESLPFPLPGRPNLVLTRNPEYKAERAEVFTDMKSMVGRGYELAGLRGTDEVMVIGGAKLYASLLPFCQRMYISRVKAKVSGDAYFPKFKPTDWMKSYQEDVQAGPKDDYPFSIEIYDRR